MIAWAAIIGAALVLGFSVLVWTLSMEEGR